MASSLVGRQGGRGQVEAAARGGRGGSLVSGGGGGGLMSGGGGGGVVWSMALSHLFFF